MKKLLIVAMLTISSLLYSMASQAGNTQVTAEILECSTCYSNYDFKQKAKQNAERNDVSFFLVFNGQTHQLKTIRTINVDEPRENINFTRARIVATLSEHQVSFDQYLLLQQSGDVPSVIEVDVDQNFDFSAPYDIFIPVNRYLLNQYGAFYKLTVPIGTIITVTTSDGTRIVLVKTSAMAATPAQYLIAMVLDEEGNIIDIIGGGSMTNTGGGANGGGSTSIWLPGGVLICFGECSESEGEVIPGPIIPSED